MSANTELIKRENDKAISVAHFQQPLTAEMIKANRDTIHRVMESVMEKDIHYGVIPGCGKKPSLYKPGSEILLSTFRIACTPVVADLSTMDECKYRVETKAHSMASGAYLGSGIGEASSSEEKYKWRRAVCDKEFEATPEDRRRIKLSAYQERISETKQIRTNPADVANTVLKMAKKRSQIDMTLTITAASEVFQQDLEDMEEMLRQSVSGQQESNGTPPPLRKPQRTTTPTPPAPRPPATGAGAASDTISDPQRKRLYAIYKSTGISDSEMKGHLMQAYGIDTTAEIKRSDYDAICQWAESGGATREPGEEAL